MRKASKDETDNKVALMLKEATRAYNELRDHVEANELEPYLNEDSIKGDLVDEDENITPEQVAILGGYSVAYQIKKQLEKIATGTDKKIKMVTVEVKNGKATMTGDTNLPKEVLDAMKNIIKRSEGTE
jgi:hypothetical protein